ncbi:MAG: neuraminidase-like domain-containing protein, partial [Candidatus Entotheonellia bacterium]
EDFVSLRAYLKDLLDFAGPRVTVAPDGTLLDQTRLAATFHQPFERLADPTLRDVTTRPVHQVRICIEVLRRFLGDQPAEVESGYRAAAYYALLRHLGTSYEEIRLARVADARTRETLAERLGIDLGPSQPDSLDRLLLQPDQIVEADLEALFGLADTRRDPLEPGTGGVPDLLTWRRQHLRASWRQQDHADRPDAEAPVPIVDPDLVGESDLKNPAPGNVAYDLWQGRRAWVAGKREEIKRARDPSVPPSEGFNHIISTFLGQVDLEALAKAREEGHDIEPQLKELQLSLQAFLYLVQVRHLASAGTVLEAEWEDVYDILVHVQKRREKYAEWQLQEQSQNLTLSPDDFKPPAPGASASASPVELPHWRATRQARQTWQDTIEARITQEQALVQELQAAVDATEEATLPLLRDAIVSAVEPGERGVDAANWLTQRLLIDVLSSGTQKTTRLHQAIETLQGVLFSVRTDRFDTMGPLVDDVPPKAWALATDEGYTENDFDQEWQWMGSYNTWRAAMVVFAYPENYVLPSLQEKHAPNQNPTGAFRTMVEGLRGSVQLTPGQAREAAGTYLKELREAFARDDVGPRLPPELQDESFELTEQLSERELAERRDLVKKLFDDIRVDLVDANGAVNPHLAPNYLKEVFYFVPLQIGLQLQRSGQYLAALDWFQTVYAYNLPMSQRKIYHGLVLEEALPTEFRREVTWLLDGLNPHDIVVDRANAYTRFTLMSLVRCVLDFANAEFTRETMESIPRARTLYVTALDLLNLPEMRMATGGDGVTPPANRFPPNPVIESLRLHAELNLFKLRSGRNIAGMERQSELETQASGSTDGLPVVDSSGRLVLPQPASRQPTPYRYVVLIERAKQLVTLAQQLEAAYLAALEKRDAEAYNLLRARQDIQLTKATVALQDLRVREADDGIALARLQRERAHIQSETYQEWIDAGLNEFEHDMIESYKEAGAARRAAAAYETTAGIFSGFGSITNPMSAFTWRVSAGMSLEAEDATMRAIAAETSAQVASIQASHERRKQEWELQKSLAEQDTQIGAQQIILAEDHTRVVRQERTIAGMQAEHAEAAADFLANKFTNAELYEWMSGILGRVYGYFLQQATAVAQLAQHQLTFERQEPPPAFIQADYWQPPSETATASGTDGQAPDRRGLTGSARLLQDIYRLDQYAFQTKTRRLQLSQTFSLAQLAPFEFQRFRGTGVLPFATPMDLFDRAFPGQYLRLIKRVRTSVIALIPPTRGIRATLAASGLSRVVTGGDVFQSTVVRRSPELVAFTSPSNATGLFELEPEGEMLLPFEGMGMDTTWELQMPKAANPFDYRTLADALITIEYTALHSAIYRQQVIRQLDRTASADRPFSLRQQFADAWYDLHNPDQSDAPMTVQFTTRRADFPPNLEDLKIQQLLLAFVRADGASFEVDVDLQFTSEGSQTSVGGPAQSIDGIISTRRSNAGAWLPMLGPLPVGTWTLALPDTHEVRSRFKDGQIDDILFVITYSGETPAWPA